MRVIGGVNGTYQGFSGVCSAAMHAAIISQWWGGCFSVQLSGPQPLFYEHMGVNRKSTSWPWSPLSFTVKPIKSSLCAEQSVLLSVVGVIWVAVLVLLVRPTRRYLIAYLLLWGQYHVFTVANSGELMSNELLAASASMVLVFGAAYWFVV